MQSAQFIVQRLALANQAMNSKIFSHVPLSTNGQYIRLVKIKAVKDHGANELGLDLAVHQFTDSLAYNAASYEWGNAEAAAQIQINGQIVSIRQNLHDFLEILSQSAYKDEWLFIDAICIDQANILERNAQVQRMGDIYRQAQVVLVWLGPATPESDVIFNMCQTHAVSTEEDALAAISWEEEIGDALDTIYQRSYWTRLWIIQELLLARSIVFFCGPKLTPWSVFRRLPRSVKGIFYEGGFTGMDIKLGSTPRGRHARSVLSALEERSSKEDQTEQQLHKLVVNFGKAKCFDNRDRVFGLLGLACQKSPERQSLDVLADYSAEPSELFVRLLSNMTRKLDVYAARDIFDILELHTDLSVFTENGQLVNEISATISDLSFEVDFIHLGHLKHVSASLCDWCEMWKEREEAREKDAVATSNKDCTLHEIQAGRAQTALAAHNVGPYHAVWPKDCCVVSNGTSACEGDDVFVLMGTNLVIIQHIESRDELLDEEEVRFEIGYMAYSGDNDSVTAASQKLTEYLSRLPRKVVDVGWLTNSSGTKLERKITLQYTLTDAVLIVAHAATHTNYWSQDL
ncbi:heterokaryon incompatibility domain-containing protein [Trichoderma sp. TUCIM 5745]